VGHGGELLLLAFFLVYLLILLFTITVDASGKVELPTATLRGF
jgi:hypothetical protein